MTALASFQSAATQARARTVSASSWREQARPEQLPPDEWGRVWFIRGGRGSGKLLDVTTPIPTPDGWRKLGDLAVGDRVFDEQGRPCSITATNDATPEVAYCLGFSDGSTINACSEHLWITWTHAERKAYLRSSLVPDHTRFVSDWPIWRARNGAGPQVRTTQEIVDTLTHGHRADLNHCIPQAGPLDLPEADLPIDPWLLGYWLGDGTSVRADLTVAEADLPFVTARLTLLGHPFTIYRTPTRTPAVRITGGLHSALGALGVRIGRGAKGSLKHVPERYLWASIQQRSAILAGLLDSDGTATDRNTVEFCSTVRLLAEAVVQLARSLGERPVLAESRSTLRGVDHGARWRVTWRPIRQPFTMPRKAARIADVAAQGLRAHHRMIVTAERIDPRPMRCLTVDSPHRTYLCGEAMIPTHNTWTASGEMAELISQSEPGEWGVVGPTFGDARDVCMEGQRSGLLRAFGCKVGTEGRLIERGPLVAQWNRSNGQLRLHNGSIVFTDGADDGALRIQGHNLSGLWGDEVGLWRNWKTAWEESIRYAVRITPAKIIVTGTPKRNMPARRLVKNLLDDPEIVRTQLFTEDNAANLDPATMAEFMKSKGTVLERQELRGDLLEEAEGALWTMANIDAGRVANVGDLARVVVGIDPAVTASADSDSTGIIVAGRGVDGHGYVLADRSCRLSPDGWARRAVAAYGEFGADRLVAEVNNGGDMVEGTLRTVDPDVPYRKLHASRGKRTRAEPIAALYEQGKIHHAGAFVELEDELTQWTPESGDSPDRLDALVWTLTELMLGGTGEVRVGASGGRIPLRQRPSGTRQWR